MVAAAGVASSNAASPAADTAADEEAEADGPDRLRQDQPRDISSGRTERHPHADFPGALLDEVRQHAEQARQRQRQGQPAEDDRQPERDLQEVGVHPGQRPHGHHLRGPCWDRSLVNRLRSVCRASSGSPWTRATSDVLGIAALVGT